jgi:hypothetical protein
VDKTYITAQELPEDSFRLAHKIYEDGFYPQFIIGIWRGGTHFVLPWHQQTGQEDSGSRLALPDRKRKCR